MGDERWVYVKGTSRDCTDQLDEEVGKIAHTTPKATDCTCKCRYERLLSFRSHLGNRRRLAVNVSHFKGALDDEVKHVAFHALLEHFCVGLERLL